MAKTSRIMSAGSVKTYLVHITLVRLSPFPGHLERARPNASARGLGPRRSRSDHFALAVAIGHRPAFLRQPLGDVSASNVAACKPSAVAILSCRIAANSSRIDPVGQRQRRLLAATPLRSISRGAGLLSLQRVDVENPDAFVMNVDRVAINARGPSVPRMRRRMRSVAGSKGTNWQDSRAA